LGSERRSTARWPPPPALSEIGLPPSEIPIALLFFNIGVEIGQIIFVIRTLIVYRVLRGLSLLKMLSFPQSSGFLPHHPTWLSIRMISCAVHHPRSNQRFHCDRPVMPTWTSGPIVGYAQA